MTKQVKKSSIQHSLFKKLSLGEMICGWISVVLAGLAVGLINVAQEYDLFILIAAGVAALAAFGLAIGQMVTLKKYGDIFGKLTKKNATIIFAVFTALTWIGIIIAAIFLFLRAQLPHDEEFIELRRIYSIISLVGIFIMELFATGYTITSTIAFVKAK